VGYNYGNVSAGAVVGEGCFFSEGAVKNIGTRFVTTFLRVC